MITIRNLVAPKPIVQAMYACTLMLLCISFTAQGDDDLWLPQSGKLSGYGGVEARYFFDEPIHDGQQDQAYSAVIEPSYYYEWDGGKKSFSAKAFARWDSVDDERSHYDIRELYWNWVGSGWELGAGIGKVFWGVTESQHLVDIINQTDGVEFTDGEDKLGQPMIRASLIQDWGTLSLFVLPNHRERSFPGRDGRLRSEFFINTAQTRYENSAEEDHVDFAMRYEQVFGDWEVGLSHFRGTSREPTLLVGGTPFAPYIFPFYEQIRQSSVDLLWVVDAWIWKMEAIYRTGQRDREGVEYDYSAFTGGFEYTLSNIANSNMDLGLLGEYLYDERDQYATTPFQNDILLGGRFTMNDVAGSEALFGVIHDNDGDGDYLFVEASRRFGNNWKINLDAMFFMNQEPQDFLYSVREDDFLQLQLNYHF